MGRIRPSDIMDAMKGVGSRYATSSPALAEDLSPWMEEKKVKPYEYVYWVARNMGVDKVVAQVLKAGGTKTSFLADRDIRKNENKIRVGLERDRIRYLLKKGEEVSDIADDPKETFMALVRFLLAGVAEDDALREKYHRGALNELRTAPELLGLLYEFPRHLFPDKWGPSNG
jgi:hypothetical protein